ncbi:Glycosyl transferase family 2 [Butyrivibrio sp. Su6]|uniref:glycosyltransferase family 2 protein n=1 Tax=Butyrivibrio sp. Su6 TaxID=1520810 RepID=UPI00089F6EE2|nr:glycosyltransferase family 2 protein [Butyrivibrio sp. Su6]SEG14740.1 Glycosyl transferase family 2 [Butyrivibrio sp. Su6]
MEKKVSIIIPVYQAAKYLERCVESCLGQKGINADELEIILVDDGSTDGSSELADELERSANCVFEGKGDKSSGYIVKAIHTGNHGVSHARNLGIEKANGKYICFVDADDYVSESFVANLLAAEDRDNATDEESTVIKTNSPENVEKPGEISQNCALDGYEPVIIDSTDTYLSGLNISGYQYIENSILNRNTHVWGKLFLLSAIRDNHITFKEGLTIGEDLLFLLDLALLQGKKKTVKCTGTNGYVYVDNPEGAMKKAFKESYLDEVVCWREAEEKLLGAREYISEYSFVSVAVSQIMTALLVAGKLARTDEAERDKDIETLVISKVREQVSHALKVRGAFAALEFGYKIKVTIFRFNPKFYLRLYGNYKSQR